jgi:hypothetical protein
MCVVMWADSAKKRALPVLIYCSCIYLKGLKKIAWNLSQGNRYEGVSQSFRTESLRNKQQQQ